MAFASDPFGSPFGAHFYSGTSSSSTAARCRVLGIDGDYERATDGSGNLATAGDPVDEEMYFRLRTALVSFRGDLSLGFGFAQFQTLSDASPIAIRDACIRALDPMRARGAVSAVTVTSSTNAAGGTGRVLYRVDVTKTGVRST